MLIPMLLTCGGICVTQILWIFLFRVTGLWGVSSPTPADPEVLASDVVYSLFCYARRHWGHLARLGVK